MSRLNQFQLNEALLELFRSHGVVTKLQGKWLVFPKSGMRTSAAIVTEIAQQTGMIVQLDVKFEMGSGCTLIESFAGLGETTETAALDAFRNFVTNSFHVLLGAFFGQSDTQVFQDDWSSGSVKRRVTIGNAWVRGNLPIPNEQVSKCLERFEQQVKEKNLAPQTHWVRMYYAQAQGKSTACEVLLDNGVCEEMQSEIEAYDWPCGEEFYSVRVFLVIMYETEQRGENSFRNRLLGFRKRSG